MRDRVGIALACLLVCAFGRAPGCGGGAQSAKEAPAPKPVQASPSTPVKTVAAERLPPPAAPAVAAAVAPAQVPTVVAPQPASAAAVAEPAPSAATATPPAPIDAQHALVAEALRYDPADPLADLEKADALDRGAAHAHGPAAKIPDRGCALDDAPRRIWPAPGTATLAALGNDFVVAGYVRDTQGERLFVVQLTAAGAATPVASLRIEPPSQGARVAGPGIAASSTQGVTLAYTNGAGVLLMQRLQVGATHGAALSLELARGIDLRFAPAVAYGKRVGLVAYTLGTTPMRSKLARIGVKGEVLDTHDITPAALGAAAPAFVQGAEPLMIVTADARNGMSPIARVKLAEDGTPGMPEVAAPVGMMSQPPQLTAASASFGAYVGYTGLGSAATSAVGLVRIAPQGGAPEALVKGTAYGTLHVASASSGELLFFAAETPLSPGKNPKHAVTLTRIDAHGRGTPLTIESPSGDATQVALSRANDGTLGVSWNGGDAIYFARARCEAR